MSGNNRRNRRRNSLVDYIEQSFDTLMGGGQFCSSELRKRITPEEKYTTGPINGFMGFSYNESYNFTSSIGNSYSPSTSCSLTDGYVSTGSCRPH